VHELSIAHAIVDVAARHAGDRAVSSVQVRVGHLRQVVPSALRFAFELCAHGTVVEGAELDLEHVAATGVCRSCGMEGDLPGFPLACPACGGLQVEVITGEELLVDSLELEEADVELSRSGG
jgi:hydrogenase nickel incorporation protein HypA/HybF